MYGASMRHPISDIDRMIDYCLHSLCENQKEEERYYWKKGEGEIDQVKVDVPSGKVTDPTRRLKRDVTRTAAKETAQRKISAKIAATPYVGGEPAPGLRRSIRSGEIYHGAGPVAKAMKITLMDFPDQLSFDPETIASKYGYFDHWPERHLRELLSAIGIANSHLSNGEIRDKEYIAKIERKLFDPFAKKSETAGSHAIYSLKEKLKSIVDSYNAAPWAVSRMGPQVERILKAIKLYGDIDTWTAKQTSKVAREIGVTAESDVLRSVRDAAISKARDMVSSLGSKGIVNAARNRWKEVLHVAHMMGYSKEDIKIGPKMISNLADILTRIYAEELAYSILDGDEMALDHILDRIKSDSYRRIIDLSTKMSMADVSSMRLRSSPSVVGAKSIVYEVPAGEKEYDMGKEKPEPIERPPFDVDDMRRVLGQYMSKIKEKE